MIVPDINLLLYAYDSTSPDHAKAAGWWRACLSGTEPVGMPQVVAFGFLRIATNARAFDHPMLPAEAITHVRSWLKQPNVQLLEADPRHAERVFELLEAIGTAGNLVSDAQIAATAIEQDAILHTADTDFLRFPNLRWYNPLTGTGSHTVRKTRK